MTAMTPPVSSDARGRALVLLAGMAALTLACTVIVQHGDEFSAAALVPLLALLVVMLVGFAGVRAPGLLSDPDSRTFEVPPNYVVTTTSTMAIIAPLAFGVHLSWHPLLVAFVVVIVAGAVRNVGDLVWRRPRLELTPDGLRFRSRFSGYDVPWTAMSPHPVRRGRLQVEQPEQVVGHGPARRAPRTISTKSYNIAWRGLAQIVERYLNQPELRERIGTPAEYAEVNLMVDKSSRVFPYWTGPNTVSSK
jgi:hypothetical protein